MWGIRPEIGTSEFCGSWKLYWPDNNWLDMAAEGLDFAIRFDRGFWNGTDVTRLLQSVYSGDAVKSKAIGILSADPVNAHIDAILIKRTRRARPSSHSYAMVSPPSAK